MERAIDLTDGESDMKNDLISRQDAIDAIFGRSHEIIKARLRNLPPAQPLTAYVISDEDGNIKCSNCGSFECWGNYCMNCGAKMRGKQDE